MDEFYEGFEVGFDFVVVLAELNSKSVSEQAQGTQEGVKGRAKKGEVGLDLAHNHL